MDPIDFKLLNDFQRRFPLVPRPFAVLAQRCATTEDDVLIRLRRLAASGTVSRVGAVFAPNRVGASTLFALRVPPHRLDEIAGIVDGFDAVNHNYEREHEFNLWAVATAPEEAALEVVLDEIRAATQAPLLDLRLQEEFRIDLGFDLRGRGPSAQRSSLNGPRITLRATEGRLLSALQPGLPLVAEPFLALGFLAGVSEAAVIACLARWIGDGIVRRFGVVVRHRELGYRANAMAVWDIPDDRVSHAGRMLAATPGVTLAYRRTRRAPHWPYNLFCMVHGKERAAAASVVDGIARSDEVAGCPHAVLFSRRRFKQTGARYVPAESMVAHG